MENPLLRGLQFYIHSAKFCLFKFLKNLLGFVFSNPSKTALGGSSSTGGSHIPRGTDLTDLEREASLSLGKLRFILNFVLRKIKVRA